MLNLTKATPFEKSKISNSYILKIKKLNYIISFFF